MTDTPLIRCSSCKCHRAETAFRVNKKGGRLKTCLACNERRRKPIAPPIKLVSFADPPAPIVTLSRADQVRVGAFIESQLGEMHRYRQQVWVHWQKHQREKIELRNQKIRALLTCPGTRRKIYFVPKGSVR